MKHIIILGDGMADETHYNSGRRYGGLASTCPWG